MRISKSLGYIYIIFNNYLFIITGKNTDQLYIYNRNTNQMHKTAKTRNNHSFDSLAFILNISFFAFQE